MPGIKIKTVNDKNKPNLVLKPNHFKYSIVPKNIWLSDKNGTAIKSGKWYVKESDIKGK